MNRLYDLIWNLIPLAATWTAMVVRTYVNPPYPPLANFLSSYGFDFGLASIFAFIFGRHINKVYHFKYRWRVSSLAAISVGVFATLTEVGHMFPMSTFDPFDIVVFWIGIAYALVGLKFLPVCSEK